MNSSRLHLEVNCFVDQLPGPARDIVETAIAAGEVTTRHGTTLMSTPSSSSGLRINEARVVTADLVASNGIIHAIDAVLLPENWQLAAA